MNPFTDQMSDLRFPATFFSALSPLLEVTGFKVEK